MSVDIPKLRDRLDLPAAVVSDEELQEILDACLIQQDERCIMPMNAATDRALIRRVAREVAAKGMPLGAQATEYGSFYIPGWQDPIIGALEAPYLRGGFA